MPGAGQNEFLTGAETATPGKVNNVFPAGTAGNAGSVGVVGNDRQEVWSGLITDEGGVKNEWDLEITAAGSDGPEIWTTTITAAGDVAASWSVNTSFGGAPVTYEVLPGDGAAEVADAIRGGSLTGVTLSGTGANVVFTATAADTSFTLSITPATNGTHSPVETDPAAGAWVVTVAGNDATYPLVAGDTATLVATGLQPLIHALAGVTATRSGAVITILADARNTPLVIVPVGAAGGTSVLTEMVAADAEWSVQVPYNPPVVYALQAGDTPTLVATGLKTLLDAVPNIDVQRTGATLTITGDYAGQDVEPVIVLPLGGDVAQDLTTPQTRASLAPQGKYGNYQMP
jgi:phage tail sheath gpL-like